MSQSNIFINKDYDVLIQNITKCDRPVLLINKNTITNNVLNIYYKFRKKLNIPELVYSESGESIFDDDLYYGCPGVYANIYSNFIIQNANLIISLGDNFIENVTGHFPETFSKISKKIIIDNKQYLNRKGIYIDFYLKTEILDFMQYVLYKEHIFDGYEINDWKKYCNKLRKKYKNQERRKEILYKDKEGHIKSLPLEYMSPPIDMKELKNNMIIPEYNIK